jgi:hypothetical protein
MEPTSSTAKLIRALLLSVILVIAFEAYQIAHSPPAERRRKIFALVVTVVTAIVIVVLTARKRTTSPGNPRLSHFTLAGIALVVIIIAVLSRHL